MVNVNKYNRDRDIIVKKKKLCKQAVVIPSTA